MKVFYRKNDENFDLLLMRRPFFKTKKKQAGPKKPSGPSNGEISTERKICRLLFKYQPADRILREIHAGIGKGNGRSMDTKSIWRGEKQMLPCILPGIIGFGHHFTDSGRTVVGRKKIIVFEF